jgi:hypothetical protein
LYTYATTITFGSKAGTNITCPADGKSFTLRTPSRLSENLG